MTVSSRGAFVINPAAGPPMRNLGWWIMLVLLGLTKPAAAADIDPQQVRTSIERATNFLRNTQDPQSGLWNSSLRPEGVSSLCLLAWFNAGVDPTDPRFARGLHAVERFDQLEHVYVVSLQVMLFCAVDPQRYKAEITRRAKWLEDAQISGGPRNGSWTYGRGGGAGDNSNTQFALLALYEAERAGVEISSATWNRSYKYWVETQNQRPEDQGSFGYVPNMPGTGSMTCAGIASLIITSEETQNGDARVNNGVAQCCLKHSDNKELRSALLWLDEHFSVDHNPGHAGGVNTLYYLYALERVGRMTNQRFIGKHDWYREGTERLLAIQDKLDGSWTSQGTGEGDRNVATSFALLFLAKGRRPVLATKLVHSPFSDWENHRHDLSYLTSFVEKEWHRDLTWQIVDPSGATVEDLLQSKVIFLSGAKRPQFSDAEAKLLREYLDRGGFLFADACCGGADFEAGLNDLIQRMYPSERYRLELLPPSHPIWGAEKPVDPEYVRTLKGINIGCRTAIVFCPENLSCYWELARTERIRKTYSKKVKHEIDACLAMGINVLAYATNREVKFKSELFAETARGTADPVDRGKIHVARLGHAGGCNTAPAAAVNLLRLAAEKLNLRVRLEVPEISINDPKLFRHHLVVMHGQHGFALSDEERQNLRAYLERGGILLADSVCSNPDFDAAFRREMAIVFPKASLERIPLTHPLYSDQLGGETIQQVHVRHPDRAAAKGPLLANIREEQPSLEGIKIEGRYAVIYSKLDLSCALENHESLECEGHTREDAARLGINILLYSLHQQ